ncbi:hypothetical protein LCGC14_1235310 [marine sediment metagenome]|uniref:Uncharacterized protein n=1 Tax=marine sediment metagenome TaxID=412755 RepID=A0A0F9L7C5_9ZZZZ
MEKEYSICIEKFHNEWFWTLRKGETLIDFMPCEEARKQRGTIGAYFLKKHNIPSKVAEDYSSNY